MKIRFNLKIGVVEINQDQINFSNNVALVRGYPIDYKRHIDTFPVSFLINNNYEVLDEESTSKNISRLDNSNYVVCEENEDGSLRYTHYSAKNGKLLKINYMDVKIDKCLKLD